MKANLVLHCGAAAVAREIVYQVKTPSRTDSWCPIPHHDFITQVEKALGAVNMRVVEQAHALTKEGNRYFGLLQVANCQSTGEDYSYIVGLRNSHDKSYPAGLVVGSQVFVCDNLSFSGEIQIARKHTSRIMDDLPKLTVNAVGMLAQKWTVMGDRIARYKVSEINDAQAHDFIIRAVDGGATTLNQVPAILKEWRTPSHPEFATGKTAWRLFNSFTEAAKDGSLALLPRRTISLHGLMDAQVGFLGAEGRVLEGTTDAEVIVNN
jgi:hypothetical protein